MPPPTRSSHMLKQAGPNRDKDVLLDILLQEQHYNAYEKDIAVVHIFFGKSTVFGRVFSYKWSLYFKLLWCLNIC